jgi:hypothetical protein
VSKSKSEKGLLLFARQGVGHLFARRGVGHRLIRRLKREGFWMQGCADDVEPERRGMIAVAPRWPIRSPLLPQNGKSSRRDFLSGTASDPAVLTTACALFIIFAAGAWWDVRPFCVGRPACGSFPIR